MLETACYSLGRRMLRSLRASGGGISLLKVRTTFRLLLKVNIHLIIFSKEYIQEAWLANGALIGTPYFTR